MNSLSFLIKPASGCCNMSCAYCFYKDTAYLRTAESKKIMPKAVAKKLIERAFETDATDISFAFQGGEPTLAGIDFFNDFISHVNALNTSRRSISYSIQTNGLLINDEFAAFFKKHGFLVGISLDGTEKIHNLLRKAPNESGSYTQVMNAIETLKRHGVDFNILTVVSSYIAENIEEVYRSYKSLGFKYLQFINCLDSIGTPFGEHYSLSVEQCEQYLTELFELYYNDFVSGNYTSIRYFDNLVLMAKGRIPEMCGMLGRCSAQLVIEADGSVYPCDFYCTDSQKLGNISDTSIDDILASDRLKDFIKATDKAPEKCLECRYYRLCFGGCRRSRIEAGAIIKENVYCQSLKSFFEKEYDKLIDLAINGS